MIINDYQLLYNTHSAQAVARFGSHLVSSIIAFVCCGQVPDSCQGSADLRNRIPDTRTDHIIRGESDFGAGSGNIVYCVYKN